MKYIKKLIRNSKRALNQLVSKNKQEIVKYAPRLTGIQDEGRRFLFDELKSNGKSKKGLQQLKLESSLSTGMFLKNLLFHKSDRLFNRIGAASEGNGLILPFGI